MGVPLAAGAGCEGERRKGGAVRAAKPASTSTKTPRQSVRLALFEHGYVSAEADDKAGSGRWFFLRP